MHAPMLTSIKASHYNVIYRKTHNDNLAGTVDTPNKCAKVHGILTEVQL